MTSQFFRQTWLAMAALLACLSISTALGQKGAIPFNGTFDGQEIDVVQAGSLLVDGSGQGTASVAGKFTFTWQVTVDLSTGLSSGGVLHLTSANGDVINGTFVGSGAPTDTPNVAHVIELVSITGGTGRFEGASGNFTIDRLVDQATGLTSGSMTGTISSPGSNR